MFLLCLGPCGGGKEFLVHYCIKLHLHQHRHLLPLEVEVELGSICRDVLLF